MSFRDYSLTPADNTELGDGTYIGPNMLRNKVRPALQQLAADGRELADIIVPPGVAAARAGKYLAFDADGNATVSSGTGEDGSLRPDLAASAGSTLVSFLQAGTGAVAKTLQTALRLGLPVMPEHFGAAGDGVTDDQAAFDLLNAFIVANNGANIMLGRGKTYVGGKQTLTSGRFREAGAFIHADGVAFLKVDGNGATLKFKNGLYFGTFNRTTGLSAGTVAPYTTDATLIAEYPYGVWANAVAKVSINGLTLNMNAANATLGGQWGDQGYQVPGYGIYVVGCEAVEIIANHVYDSPCDGILYHYSITSETDAIRPARIADNWVERCGRNCMTVTGGNGVVEVNNVLIHAGSAAHASAPGGYISTNPRSCHDAEAEAGSIVRNLVIISGRHISNARTNTSFVADSGDTKNVTFNDCLLVGVFYNAKPGVLLKGCRIYGALIGIMGNNDNPADNTHFIDCYVSDEDYAGFSIDSGSYGSVFNSTGNGDGVVFRGGTFVLSKISSVFSNTIFEPDALVIKRNTDNLASGAAPFTLGGSTTTFKPGKVMSAIATAKAPASAYVISMAFTEDVDTTIEVVAGTASGKLIWPGGAQGKYTTTRKRVGELLMSSAVDFPDSVAPMLRQRYGTAAPASGAWLRGEIVYNSAPAAAGKLGWVCVTAGSPGTWKPFGAIDA